MSAPKPDVRVIVGRGSIVTVDDQPGLVKLAARRSNSSPTRLRMGFVLPVGDKNALLADFRVELN